MKTKLYAFTISFAIATMKFHERPQPSAVSQGLTQIVFNTRTPR